MLSSLLEGVLIAFSWPVVGWMVVGLLVGIFCGAMPGLGASLGMALALPLTLPLDGPSAIILLVSIYSGAMYGGSIAAILINVPGTAAAAATTIDGYPMSKQGKATNALAISATSSALAGFLAIIVLFLLSPFLVEIVLAFGTPEYFLMAILGLAMITIITRGSLVKGLAAGGFGMLFTVVGVAPMNPEDRFTFGSFLLYDGLSYIAALIGLFAIAEMLKLSSESGSISDGFDISGSKREGFQTAIKNSSIIGKSSLIGMVVGAIPGAGASVSTFVSYGETMRSTKDDSKFGHGDERGVVAAESANNGTISGSLIPCLSFGIPGSSATAVLLGGLIMHGLLPGPGLFEENLHITYSLFTALFLGNIIILIVGMVLITRAGYVTRIDTNYLIPIIIVLSLAGGMALRSNWIDVFTVVFLGIIGYYLKKNNFSLIAFVLGAVLGPIAEENFVRSLQLSDGSPIIFLTRPISLVIVILIFVIIFGPVVKRYREQ